MSASTRKASPAPEKQRKRPRAALACEQCRARKYRCDEQYPCRTCKKHGWDCVYKGGDNFRRNQRAPSYVAELEREVRALRSRLGIDPEMGMSPDGPAAAAAGPAEPSGPVRPRGSGAGGGPEGDEGGGGGGTDADDVESGSDPASLTEGNSELRDLNELTNAIEFHGSTSSIAFLALARSQHAAAEAARLGTGGASFELPFHTPSLVSTLQNAAFSPTLAAQGGGDGDSGGAGAGLGPGRGRIQRQASSEQASDEDFYDDAAEGRSPTGLYSAVDTNYHAQQAPEFIDAFFQNLHLIHPIVDRADFAARCEDLWRGRLDQRRPRNKSFVALYFGVLALGASARAGGASESAWDGLSRRQWVLRFFDLGQGALGQARSAPNDLDSVQALILLAKVCQTGLNSHMAYIFLGLAVRACLSAGYHREPRARGDDGGGEGDSGAVAAAISRTWWALYSFEMEVSFSLGRPDGLGADEHHNRRMPPVGDTETDVIACMVPFARITRKVALFMCAAHRATMRDRIARAQAIAAETDAWVAALPEKMRPTRGTVFGAPGVPNLPIWARRQRLVLHLRYCNIRMVLFRPFLVVALSSRHRSAPPPPLLAAVEACIEAAQRTIDAIHAVFTNHRFFRSWFYNTTYVLYAGTIMLCCASRFLRDSPAAADHAALEPLRARRDEFARYVEMTVEVLEMMRESNVARAAAGLLRQSLDAVRQRCDGPAPLAQPPRRAHQPFKPPRAYRSSPASPSGAQALQQTGFPPTPDSGSARANTPSSILSASFPSAPPQPPWPIALPPPQMNPGAAGAGVSAAAGPLPGPKQEFGPPRMASDPSFSEVLDEPMPFLPMDPLFGMDEAYGVLFDDSGGFGGAVAEAGGWPDFGAFGAGGGGQM